MSATSEATWACAAAAGEAVWPRAPGARPARERAASYRAIGVGRGGFIRLLLHLMILRAYSFPEDLGRGEVLCEDSVGFFRQVRPCALRTPPPPHRSIPGLPAPR